MSGYKTTVHGFEDYYVVNFSNFTLTINNISSWYIDRDYNSSLLVPVGESTVREIRKMMYSSTSNKQLLDTAKTIYVHPSCSIPRTSVAEKYKKVLNPWLADVVAIPDMVKHECTITGRCVVFVSEEDKIVVLFKNMDKSSYDKIKELKHGTKFKDVLNSEQTYNMYRNFATRYSYYPGLLEAELDYCGYALMLDNNNLFFADLVDNNIPKNKIVYEEDVMASLGNETNVPTFENLLSIMEMLKSKDEETVSAAIKALSCLDYVNYPNSVKYILLNTSAWRRNKAANSTSAKYMWKTLLRSRYKDIRFEDRTINKEDWELFRNLVFDQQGVYSGEEFLRKLSFTYEDVDYQVFPHLTK